MVSRNIDKLEKIVFTNNARFKNMNPKCVKPFFPLLIDLWAQIEFWIPEKPWNYLRLVNWKVCIFQNMLIRRLGNCFNRTNSLIKLNRIARTRIWFQNQVVGSISHKVKTLSETKKLIWSKLANLHYHRQTELANRHIHYSYIEEFSS